MHIYPIFSPRSNLIVVTWLGVIGIQFIFYKMWNKLMENHMEYLQITTLLSVMVGTASTCAIIGFFLSKNKARILKSEWDGSKKAGGKS